MLPVRAIYCLHEDSTCSSRLQIRIWPQEIKFPAFSFFQFKLKTTTKQSTYKQTDRKTVAPYTNWSHCVSRLCEKMDKGSNSLFNINLERNVIRVLRPLSLFHIKKIFNKKKIIPEHLDRCHSIPGRLCPPQCPGQLCQASIWLWLKG